MDKAYPYGQGGGNGQEVNRAIPANLISSASGKGKVLAPEVVKNDLAEINRKYI